MCRPCAATLRRATDLDGTTRVQQDAIRAQNTLRYRFRRRSVIAVTRVRFPAPSRYARFFLAVSRARSFRVARSAANGLAPPLLALAVPWANCTLFRVQLWLRKRLPLQRR